MKTYRTRKSGFTLIEILIVVIILGILAAIVIPQFTNASQDARKSSMASQLQTLKSQIELYKMQHRDIPPDLGTGTPDVTPGWAQITQYSNIDGTNLDPTAPDLAAVPPRNCGPYMQTPPVNPLTQSATVAAPGGAAAGGRLRPAARHPRPG
jgi:general secretion pathway protein G